MFLRSHTVRQLHRDFSRCGADVCQALTFYASGDEMNFAKKRKGGTATVVSEEDINLAAVAIAREVADEYGALISVSLCESRNYKEGKGYDDVIADFRKQLKFFVDAGCDIDYIVCEVSLETQQSYVFDTAATCLMWSLAVFPIPRRDGVGDRSCQGSRIQA